MTFGIFAHNGSEIQHNRSSYGGRAVETPEHVVLISLPDSQIRPSRTRRNRQAKRADREADKRAETAYFDAIRRDAIAAEREAARLAQWPRRALAGAS
jgi:hypothetical protein